ncbi:MAG: DUF2207 domain-containing protein [Gemmatimonadaceae bacterium]|nr:DUF2207 domain-containing protein [Gemmatimonadaceae bacterium]
MRYLLSLVWLVTSAAALPAQDRELDWPLVSVMAHLDADGRLQVRERQVIRFTGDWNGGERTFNLRSKQRLDFGEIVRLDSASGLEHPLTSGDLSNVDEYRWADSRTLRWRSRLPSDFEFSRTQIAYVLTYAYTNVLVPQSDGTYVLDHDFGFPERQGPIERFELVLTLDSVWRSSVPVRTLYAGDSLAPGVSFTVTLPLTYHGAGAPAAVLLGAPTTVRQALIVVFVSALLVLLFNLYTRERQLGRFVPLIAPGEITPAWLDEHVFSRLPEVVGAAWDDRTSAPEVAAILARMVQEKKLSSEVTRTKRLIGSSTVLHLKIVSDRSQFRDHERTLVDALFGANESTTDTQRVRERYRASGFDPARLIRSRLTRLVELTTPGAKGGHPSRRVTLMLLAVAAALLIAGSVTRTNDIGTAALSLLLSVPCYVIAAEFALAGQKRVDGFMVIGVLMLLPLGVLAYGLCWVLLAQGYERVGVLVLAGLTVWCIALANSVLNVARSRHSAPRIALRKQLTAARNYFRAQLATRQPQLQDAWFPYLIAFGLGRHIDKWFRAFGGDSTATAGVMSTSHVMSSAPTGGHSSGWTGFGGGGGFSGAGGGTSFAAAVGGMAASVPAPSSSGSSSSGGGGGSSSGSSGGGGGGGW